MIGTWLACLALSKRYREDCAKACRLEKTTLGVAIDNPLATTAQLLSFFVPLAAMGLL